MSLSPADELAILQLLYKYSHLLDSADGEGWASLFTDDGEFVEPEATRKGHAELAELARTHHRDHEGASSSQHWVHSPVITGDGDRAQVTAYVIVFKRAELPVQWKIIAGSRVVAEGVTSDGLIAWPLDLPDGSYRLQLIDASSCTEETPLLVAPARAFSGDFDRCWLLAVQLYSIRSARNWGIGDFTDLEGLLELAADLGAEGVGLNPLHALFDDKPDDCSPYSPNSRLFLNALYIDVARLDGVPAESDGITELRQRESAVASAQASGVRAFYSAAA